MKNSINNAICQRVFDTPTIFTPTLTPQPITTRCQLHPQLIQALPYPQTSGWFVDTENILRNQIYSLQKSDLR